MIPDHRPLDLSGLSPLLQFCLLLLVVFAVGHRAKLSSGISLAPPAFVPLPTDAASRFAHDFGSAFAELLAGEQRSEEA
ncbi:MAG TPA: hypothetical protein VES36_09600 [Candidatus Limnocylindrales bacterium]|nr:hypothetical protein [Candidatus Limnocylindrales bacterium]